MASRQFMIICVTGAMASGKNTAASIIESIGFFTLDFDIIAHDLIDTLKPQIVKTFNNEAIAKGIKILDSNGNINRRALGALLFSDKKLLKKQEDLLYGTITKRAFDFIAEKNKITIDATIKNNTQNVFNTKVNIVLNATLLYKTPELLKLCDKIIFIKANIIKRFIRVKKRDNLPLLQIVRRFWVQRNLLASYKTVLKKIANQDKSAKKRIIIIKNNKDLNTLALSVKKYLSNN